METHIMCRQNKEGTASPSSPGDLGSAVVKNPFKGFSWSSCMNRENFRQTDTATV